MKRLLMILLVAFLGASGLLAQSLFRSVPAEQSGVSFANDLDESACHSILQSDYFYNGAGVAIADFDGDGWQDLFWVSNFGANHLYRNLGGFRFDQQDDLAAAAPGGWKTGVTVCDVNEDGRPDLYLCRARSFDGQGPENLLLLNEGDFRFREAAAEYGIADPGNSAHAAFLDIDRDGDLDLFVVNYLSHRMGQMPESCDQAPALVNEMDPAIASNHLYLNEGGKFRDITRAAGMEHMAFGLSVSVGDVDRDGWPDIFVANDYDQKDLLYRNNGDGTFTDIMLEATRHISRFSMGSDIADVNNDGWPDLLVVDMVSPRYEKSKTNMGSMRPDLFWQMVAQGEHHQYMSNCLQVSNGIGPEGLHFSEVGQLAGIAKTDWSWAALMTDLDGDGLRDILITNGIKREIRNNDLATRFRELFETGDPVTNQDLMDLIPSDRPENYAFRNEGHIHFEDVSASWGLNHPGWSNGMAYGDLDNDGDPDLVVSNLEEPALIYENTSRQRFLRLQFAGPPGNSLGVGTSVTARFTDGSQQHFYHQLNRGFLSSMGPGLLIACPDGRLPQDLVVTWPDQQQETLHPDTWTMEVRPSGQGRPFHFEPPPPSFFAPANLEDSLPAHTENDFDDLSKQVLLPWMLSMEGPGVACYQAGDELLVAVGGAAGQPSWVWEPGTHGLHKLPDDVHKECTAAHFLDADGDGDQDLYLGYGGNEWAAASPAYQDLLYLNEGEGKWSPAPQALPAMLFPTGAVTSVDADMDGQPDLLVGGRHVPGRYPESPPTLLLRNNQGRFEVVQELVLPGSGMVTAMSVSDADGDGDQDVALALEWGPPCLLKSASGQLEVDPSWNRQPWSGLWSACAWQDLDGDGDQDLLLGNMGKNSKFKASPEHPLLLYFSDMDGNEKLDIVLASEKEGRTLPVRGRECSSEQVPLVAERFPSYTEFARADLFGIYGKDVLGKAGKWYASELRSGWLEQAGKGDWIFHPFPLEAQWSPVRSFLTGDWNADGHTDVLLAGNNYAPEVETVRMDAGTGLLMLADGQGNWLPQAATTSGFHAQADVRHLTRMELNGREFIIVWVNDGAPILYESLPRR